MATLRQTFRKDKDCKHSVVYKPLVDNPNEPAISSSIYISRLILPRPVPDIVVLTLETPEAK